ncbi:hypothetical protein HPB48_008225 [Haemaphysalis longicornis]|uniref:Uncharacterized protein n=1 Tax=Haemaphysalis longicornis TaxID=44386 RepID=A0A9J6H111_HAELO|nr:hypothetical protein HPB48_008225 [Haemaphysalis longicornis]
MRGVIDYEGNAFSKLLWSQYEDYQASLQRVVIPVLREKEARDAQFVTLCKMSRGAVKYSLQDFLHQPVSGSAPPAGPRVRRAPLSGAATSGGVFGSKTPAHRAGFLFRQGAS